MLDNIELHSLIDDLDELSTWLWMKGGSEILDAVIRLDKIIDNHRPDNMLGD